MSVLLDLSVESLDQATTDTDRQALTICCLGKNRGEEKESRENVMPIEQLR